MSLLVWAACLAAGQAAAHDVWLGLVPRDADGAELPAAQAGGRVDVRLLLSEGEVGIAALARNERLVEQFSARDPAGEFVPVPGLHGFEPAGVLRPATPGLWSIFYAGRPVEHRLEAAAFEAYLHEEGLGWVVDQRRESKASEMPGRELFSRSMEALLPVVAGEAAPSPAVGPAIVSATGSEVDLSVPLPVRFLVSSGGQGEVVLELRFHHEPVAGALVDLWVEGHKVLSRRTGQDGKLRLPLDAGSWVATTVVMESSKDPRADWRTIFASLSFPWTGR